MLQVSLGYMLMLCVMSYNTWIFLGVIVGSVLGYFISFPLLGQIWLYEHFRQTFFAFSPPLELKGSHTLDTKWETTRLTNFCVLFCCSGHSCVFLWKGHERGILHMLKNELHNTYCRIKLHLDVECLNLWSVSGLFFSLILFNANTVYCFKRGIKSIYTFHNHKTRFYDTPDKKMRLLRS